MTRHSFPYCIPRLHTCAALCIEYCITSHSLTCVPRIEWQALAYIVQPDYQNYTIYGWVHQSINAPFAFVEAGGKIANGETCGGVCFPSQGHGPRGSPACDYCASGQCVLLGMNMFGVDGTCASA